MTPSLTSLVADVYSLTNRPDLVGETLIAIKNATLKAHISDFYYKDIFETGIEFELSQAQQQLEYKTIIPRWRALKYIRKYDASVTPGVEGKFLEIITPEQVLDSYSVTKEDVAYTAGLELKIRSRTAEQYYLLGCYVYPPVDQSNFSSWIADEFPATIVYEAASTVFKSIGFDEQAAYMRQTVSEYMMLLRNSNILANGF